MQIIHARGAFPESWESAIFLAGPTPRSGETASWRPAALAMLQQAGFTGVVFVPEDADGAWRDSYLDQIGWEQAALNAADVILFWVPRALQTMPAFTTNVEFGIWAGSGKVVLGYPADAPKCRYLGWLAGERNVPVRHALSETVAAALALLGEGVARTGGERQIPLNIWRTPTFQGWYAAQRGAGNVLEGARVLWSFTPHRALQPFAWILQVQLHVAAEGRTKTDEWVFARSDLSAVVLHGPLPEEGWTRAEVVLVREARAPARTADGLVRELPGGSADPALPPQAVALQEVEQEVGLRLEPERLLAVGARQVSANLSAHQGHLYRVELDEAELEVLRQAAVSGRIFGEEDSSERITLEIGSFLGMLRGAEVDWATLGMVAAALQDAAQSSAR